jgi:uncharacterized membrane protein
LQLKNILYILIALGLIVSCYLTASKYDSAILACPNTGLINCESVITGPYSSILGVPLSVLGIILFILAAYMLFKSETYVFLWSAAGAAAVLYSILSQVLQGTFCVYCLLLDIIILATIAFANMKPSQNTAKPAAAPIS